MPLLLLRLIALVGSLAGIFFGAKHFTKTSEASYWNKGVCKKCGGHFKLVEGTRDANEKGYKCDVCDNCVWVSFGSDMGYKYIPSMAAQNEGKDPRI
jgi:hypothetical protein